MRSNNKKTKIRKAGNSVQARAVNPALPEQTENTGVELKLTPAVSMYVNTGNAQHQGARAYQEDSFGYSNLVDSKIVSEKGLLAILSDGMGGLSDGKFVSDFTVQNSIASFGAINPKLNIGNQLQNIALYVNKGICDKYASTGGMSKAGATVVMAYIFKNRIYWLAAGDSRLYCIRNRKMFQLNEDHDYKNQLFREYLEEGGSIREIEENPQKDSLVSFIGKEGLPAVDIGFKGYKIQPGDVFVLCSDGVYNAMSEDSIKDIILSCDAQTASDTIVSQIAAMAHPGQDNMTIMVIKCEKQK